MEYRLHKEVVMIGAHPTHTAGAPPTARSALSARARQRGFTLIEMLVVVGIIGLTAAATLPNLVGYVRSSRIRAAQDDVANALQRARNVAIMKNTQMGVVFVVEDDTTYWVHTEDTIQGVTAGNVGFTRQGVDFAAPNAVLSTRYALPPNVEFAANGADCPSVPGFAPAQASIRFDKYGVSTLPGVAGEAAVVLNGGSATTQRIYTPAGNRTVCLIDRQTNLRRWIQISPGGRVARYQ